MHISPTPILIPQAEVQNEIYNSTDIAVLFDTELRYVLANDVACRYLGRPASELIGQCILDLYPQMIASPNHRYLLRALNGECISNVVIESSNKQFKTTYIPFYQSIDMVCGVLVNSTPYLS